MIFESIKARVQNGEKMLVVLVDPDKLNLHEVVNLTKIAEEGGVSLFLVGGSIVANPPVKVVEAIKSVTDKPVVLFPGNPNQLVPNADAILFLSLISGRNPDFLIGHHVTSAPIIKKYNLEVIPVSYLLIDGGKTTSVEYVSNTKPIPQDKLDIVVATAMAGEMLGHQMTYLEAGSGALFPVSKQIIRKVRQNTAIPLIVGGGLRNKEEVKTALDAGADIIVVGNILEKKPEVLREIASLFKKNITV